MACMHLKRHAQVPHKGAVFTWHHIEATLAWHLSSHNAASPTAPADQLALLIDHRKDQTRIESQSHGSRDRVPYVETTNRKRMGTLQRERETLKERPQC